MRWLRSGETFTTLIVLGEIARKYLREGIEEKHTRREKTRPSGGIILATGRKLESRIRQCYMPRLG